MTILSPADRAFWEENGYVIVRKAVPQENLAAVIDAMWDFLEMDRHTPADWYKRPPWHRQTGMVELYHHQALWDNRQYPRLHQSFSEIYGTEKLWVSIDRVNMNPPARPDWDYQGFIHWDFDPTTWPIPLRVQGVLCLTDTSAEQGGFQCIPGSHRQVAEIINRQPPDRDLRRPDITGLTVKPIAANAGDLVIWHVGLLHGNGRNKTDRPRLAQYITMFPADEDNEALRRRRIELWQKRLPPDNRNAFPGDPRKLEETYGQPAALTDLGQKLLGQAQW
jgi:ectoine hydroxylase-related dioxygenase (phytanoyl-CoA dioxygenase family)